MNRLKEHEASTCFKTTGSDKTRLKFEEAKGEEVETATQLDQHHCGFKAEFAIDSWQRKQNTTKQKEEEEEEEEDKDKHCEQHKRFIASDQPRPQSREQEGHDILRHTHATRYLNRLWCNLELATFAKSHCSPDALHIVPLWLPTWPTACPQEPFFLFQDG